MRTLVVLIVLIPLVGCSNVSGARRTTSGIPSSSVPVKRKPPTLSQRKLLHNLQNPPVVTGRTQVEGALVR